MMTRILSLVCAVTLLGIMGLMVGCGATHQGRHVSTSGFLGDYSHFEKGGNDRALMHYINPDAKFASYDKIVMEPITVWPGTGKSLLRNTSENDLQKLVDYLDAAIRQELSEDYQFVDQPGPGVMIFRIALTESDSAIVAMDVVSSVVPFGMAASGLMTVATGKGSGIGEASVEFEALDGVTKERLGAAVDKRVGNKYTFEFDKLDRWRSTKGAFDFWAEHMKERLAELRAEQP